MATGIDVWEAAWAAYVQKLQRIRDLRAAGWYGYQLRMPKKSLYLAAKRLRELEPEFCARLYI